MKYGTELRLWEALDGLAASVTEPPDALAHIQRLYRRRALRRRAVAGVLLLALVAPLLAAAVLAALRRRPRPASQGLRATPP